MMEIDAQEIIGLARALPAPGIKDEELRAAIPEVGPALGAEVTAEELEQMCRGLAEEKEEEEEEVHEAFRVFDANGDGRISTEELGDALKKLGHAREGDDADLCARMISAVDENGDGYVDFKEFKVLLDAKEVAGTSDQI